MVSYQEYHIYIRQPRCSLRDAPTPPQLACKIGCTAINFMGGMKLETRMALFLIENLKYQYY